MEEFAYLVDSCLKSKVKGQFVQRNGVRIPSGQIERTRAEDPMSEERGGSYAFQTTKDCIIEMYLTDKGKVFTDRDTELDIVDFIKED